MIWTLIQAATWLLVALTFVLVAVVVWKMGGEYEQE
jgi:hypothetical protein